MDNSLRVRKIERRSHLFQNRFGGLKWNQLPCPSQHARESLAADKRHHDKSGAVMLRKVEDAEYVWMLQPSRRTRLRVKAVQEIFWLDRFGNDFDGDFAFQNRVPSAIDGPHAARSQLVDNVVSA